MKRDTLGAIVIAVLLTILGLGISAFITDAKAVDDVKVDAKVMQGFQLMLAYDRNCFPILAPETKSYIQTMAAKASEADRQTAVDYVNKLGRGGRGPFCADIERSSLPGYIGQLNAKYAPPPPPEPPKPERVKMP